jgi:hypothetical protein
VNLWILHDFTHTRRYIGKSSDYTDKLTVYAFEKHGFESPFRTGYRPDLTSRLPPARTGGDDGDHPRTTGGVPTHENPRLRASGR